jgi:hypothetical protein
MNSTNEQLLKRQVKKAEQTISNDLQVANKVLNDKSIKPLTSQLDNSVQSGQLTPKVAQDIKENLKTFSRVVQKGRDDLEKLGRQTPDDPTQRTLGHVKTVSEIFKNFLGPLTSTVKTVAGLGVKANPNPTADIFVANYENLLRKNLTDVTSTFFNAERTLSDGIKYLKKNRGMLGENDRYRFSYSIPYDNYVRDVVTYAIDFERFRGAWRKRISQYRFDLYNQDNQLVFRNLDVYNIKFLSPFGHKYQTESEMKSGDNEYILKNKKNTTGDYRRKKMLYDKGIFYVDISSSGSTVRITPMQYKTFLSMVQKRCTSLITFLKKWLDWKLVRTIAKKDKNKTLSTSSDDSTSSKSGKVISDGLTVIRVLTAANWSKKQHKTSKTYNIPQYDPGYNSRAKKNKSIKRWSIMYDKFLSENTFKKGNKPPSENKFYGTYTYKLPGNNGWKTQELNVDKLALVPAPLEVRGYNVIPTLTSTSEIGPSSNLTSMKNALQQNDISTVSTILRLRANQFEGQNVLSAAQSITSGIVQNKTSASTTILLRLMLMRLQRYHYVCSTGNFIRNTYVQEPTNLESISNLGPNFPFIAAPPAVITACAVGVSDFWAIITGDKVVTVAGFEQAEWGKSVAVVPLSKSNSLNPNALTAWTLAHMEYPYNMVLFDTNIVDNTNANVQVQTLYTNANRCRVPGPYDKVLYVFVDGANGTTSVPVVTVGGGVVPNVAVSPITNNPVGGVGANIKSAMDGFFASPFSTVRAAINLAITVWFHRLNSLQGYVETMNIISDVFSLWDIPVLRYNANCVLSLLHDRATTAVWGNEVEPTFALISDSRVERTSALGVKTLPLSMVQQNRPTHSCSSMSPIQEVAMFMELYTAKFRMPSSLKETLGINTVLGTLMKSTISMRATMELALQDNMISLAMLHTMNADYDGVNLISGGLNVELFSVYKLFMKHFRKGVPNYNAYVSNNGDAGTAWWTGSVWTSINMSRTTWQTIPVAVVPRSIFPLYGVTSVMQHGKQELDLGNPEDPKVFMPDVNTSSTDRSIFNLPDGFIDGGSWYTTSTSKKTQYQWFMQCTTNANPGNSYAVTEYANNQWDVTVPLRCRYSSKLDYKRTLSLMQNIQIDAGPFDFIPIGAEPFNTLFTSDRNLSLLTANKIASYKEFSSVEIFVPLVGINNNNSFTLGRQIRGRRARRMQRRQTLNLKGKDSGTTEKKEAEKQQQ